MAQFVVERTGASAFALQFRPAAQRGTDRRQIGGFAGEERGRGPREVLDDDSPGHRIHDEVMAHQQQAPRLARTPEQRGLQHNSGLGIEQVGDGLPVGGDRDVEVAVDVGHEDRRLRP